MRSRRSFAATLAAGLCSVAVAAAPALAAPITVVPPTSPPGQFTEQSLAADRTGANYFYRIPALAHVGDGVVLAAWDARPSSAADAPNPNSIVLRRRMNVFR